MSNTALTRADRSCFAYWPWIALFGCALLGAATGVWLAFGLDVYNNTVNGMNALITTGVNVERGEPAVIATAVAALVVLVVILGLAITRSLIEKRHDRTGVAGAGSAIYLMINAVVAICWWLLVAWLVVMVLGTAVWFMLLYVARQGINGVLAIQDQSIVPPVTGPGLPCPPNCLDLDQFSYLYSGFQDACICSDAQLQSASNYFTDGLNSSITALSGICVMWWSATVLLVNLACAYSHTKRERTLLRRAAKANMGTSYGAYPTNGQQFTAA